MPMDINQEVSANKAASITGVVAPTIIRYCEKGILPYRKRLSRRLIKLGDLKKFADSNGLDFDLSKL